MEFALFLVTQYDSSVPMAGVADELAAQTALVRDGGFDLVQVGEHHVTGEPYLLNEPVLAYLADHAGEMTLGTGMSLLPYHNPVRLAEYGATMDVLTGGQFRLGVAQGYREEELAAFGVDRADVLGRFVEGLEVIKRLWAGGPVEFDGEHFALDGLSIEPTPLQEPRPPIVTGASVERSVRRAARLTDGFVGAHVPFDQVVGQVEAFRDERADAGLGPGRVEVIREVFVAESRAEAERLVRGPLMAKYSDYVDWGQDEVFEDDDFRSPWEALRSRRFVVGSPDDAIEAIQRYDDAADLDAFGLRTQFQGMDHDDVRDSLRLFCEEVVPSFS